MIFTVCLVNHNCVFLLVRRQLIKLVGHLSFWCLVGNILRWFNHFFSGVPGCSIPRMTWTEDGWISSWWSVGNGRINWFRSSFQVESSSLGRLFSGCGSGIVLTALRRLTGRPSSFLLRRRGVGEVVWLLSVVWIVASARSVSSVLEVLIEKRWTLMKN